MDPEAPTSATGHAPWPLLMRTRGPEALSSRHAARQLPSAATSPAGRATPGLALPQASLPSPLRLLAYKDPQQGSRIRLHLFHRSASSAIADEALRHANNPSTPHIALAEHLESI